MSNNIYLYILYIYIYLNMFFSPGGHLLWLSWLWFPCLMGTQFQETMYPWLLADVTSLPSLVSGFENVEPWWTIWSSTVDGPPSGIISYELGQIQNSWWAWLPILATVLEVGIHVVLLVVGHLVCWCTGRISHGCSEMNWTWMYTWSTWMATGGMKCPWIYDGFSGQLKQKQNGFQWMIDLTIFKKPMGGEFNTLHGNP